MIILSIVHVYWLEINLPNRNTIVFNHFALVVLNFVWRLQKRLVVYFRLTIILTSFYFVKSELFLFKKIAMLDMTFSLFLPNCVCLDMCDLSF